MDQHPKVDGWWLGFYARHYHRHSGIARVGDFNLISRLFLNKYFCKFEIGLD
jgi:hypothetical protein